MAAAIPLLKKYTAAGADNVSAELIKHRWETVIDIVTNICKKIWQHHRSKKGNLQLCQNYRAFIRISQVSNAMLKIILNRLKPQAEGVIAEEQSGVRCGRSTTTLVFFGKCTPNISRTSTASSPTSRRRLVEHGILHCGHNEEKQHGPEAYQHHQVPVCSAVLVVPYVDRGPSGMSGLNNIVQHLP